MQIPARIRVQIFESPANYHVKLVDPYFQDIGMSV